MGYISQGGTSDRRERFRVIQLSGKLSRGNIGAKSFSQILLLNNDRETLLFVEQHLDSIVNNVVMAKRYDHAPDGTGPEEFGEFCKSFEPLIDAVIKQREKNLLSRMTSSLKKAILSIAIDRCNSDRTTICNALGLTEGQLDEELRLCGLRISDKSEKT